MQETIHNNTKDNIRNIYSTPLMNLVFEAASVHRKHHDPLKMKISRLISIKTGACVEDCAYCAQSARYNTGVESHKVLSIEDVLKEAADAQSKGVERVCLSASWRAVPEGKQFENVLEMIKKVKEMGLSVCCTMGMLDKHQAEELEKSGIVAYNHNLDTSDEFYPKIISTRSYADRLDTIDRLIDAGVQHCTGGILGMGESEEDRISMIHKLASMRKHPYTVPLNTLVPIKGTPLEEMPQVPLWDIVRMIATVRITMPKSMICLAAGRKQMTEEGQALCFLAGANSIFVGTKLLTTPIPTVDEDMEMLKKLGMEAY